MTCSLCVRDPSGPGGIPVRFHSALYQLYLRRGHLIACPRNSRPSHVVLCSHLFPLCFLAFTAVVLITMITVMDSAKRRMIPTVSEPPAGVGLEQREGSEYGSSPATLIEGSSCRHSGWCSASIQVICAYLAIFQSPLQV